MLFYYSRIKSIQFVDHEKIKFWGIYWIIYLSFATIEIITHHSYNDVTFFFLFISYWLIKVKFKNLKL
jgi:hypothetical protein